MIIINIGWSLSGGPRDRDLGGTERGNKGIGIHGSHWKGKKYSQKTRRGGSPVGVRREERLLRRQASQRECIKKEAR